jgi:acetylornithine/succinyldiaminopimelate/putrescine aminotransferase
MWACDHWVSCRTCWSPASACRAVYPIAACCFGERVDAFFAKDPLFHPSSYGGSELGASVVEAVVERLSAPGFLDHVGEVAGRLERGLDELCARFPTVLPERRGIGLCRHRIRTCHQLHYASRCA